MSKNVMGGYGVLIYSKFPLLLKEVEFDTFMGRTLLYGVLEINGERFFIGTAHLESLNSEKVRKT